MSNHRQIIATIKALTGQANILTIPRLFVDFTGSLDTALFLSQVLYWSDKGRNGWFYKTYADWQKEICLSEYQVRKSAKKLRSLGTLETKVKKAHGNPTVHYRLKIDEFSVSFLKFLQERKLKNFTNESEETSGTLAETTSQTTPKDYSRERATNSSQVKQESPPLSLDKSLSVFSVYKRTLHVDIKAAAKKALTTIKADPALDLEALEKALTDLEVEHQRTGKWEFYQHDKIIAAYRKRNPDTQIAEKQNPNLAIGLGEWREEERREMGISTERPEIDNARLEKLQQEVQANDDHGQELSAAFRSLERTLKVGLSN